MDLKAQITKVVEKVTTDKDLMNLFKTAFRTYGDKLDKKGIKVVFSGRRSPLPSEVLKTIDDVEEKPQWRRCLTV